jgi:hypothetical protein
LLGVDGAAIAFIVGSYFVTIPISIWAMAFMPGRGTLTPGFEKQRRNAIFVGFLPCGLLGLIVQAIGLGPYYAKVKAQERRGARLASEWNDSAGRSGGSNPFGGSGGQPAPPAAPRDNPFGDGGEGGRPPRRDNPFA